MLETFKDIILLQQYYTIFKKVLINIFNNQVNTKEITVSQKNKGNYKIVYREWPQVQKMHSKKQKETVISWLLPLRQWSNNTLFLLLASINLPN